ncbi:hypothetical protein GNP79_19440 [Aliivibrio fischeri]|uniref:Lipoprotein n=1 Tax=Aliivibrio fischeri TaxID=668 RepID=A0A6I3YPU9_ALIFS|nr:hypothetical protein [Aliivibrio fischeri]MUK45683.1 hypothetical protein [Aliivibrio fischeri]MUK71494.1 hypothetical protein [Aliivibrio fischeri]MUK75239.1 hypothetical protein [Aliivibrio fischeri]MUK82953.1 hypothetical protein [Aliivibrio fischeri]MUK86740.1 hypothetical protein [Aliivibrio fischeri]
MRIILFLLTLPLLSACISPHYCDDDSLNEDYGTLKCTLAICGDVVLAAGIVLVAVAAAEGSNSSSSSSSYSYEDPNCDCPNDYDKNGNQCGERSAWSKPGGRQPVCYGVVGN